MAKKLSNNMSRHSVLSAKIENPVTIVYVVGIVALILIHIVGSKMLRTEVLGDMVLGSQVLTSSVAPGIAKGLLSNDERLIQDIISGVFSRKNTQGILIYSPTPGVSFRVDRSESGGLIKKFLDESAWASAGRIYNNSRQLDPSSVEQAYKVAREASAFEVESLLKGQIGSENALSISRSRLFDRREGRTGNLGYIDISITNRAYIEGLDPLGILFLLSAIGLCLALWTTLNFFIKNAVIERILAVREALGRSLEGGGLNLAMLENQDVDEISLLISDIRSLDDYCNRRMDEQISDARIDATLSSIAKTAQILAHDVRRPFTMVRGLLASLNNDSDDSSGMLKRFVPEVKGAVESVNKLIGGMIEVGSIEDPILGSVDPARALCQALEGVFSTDENSAIELRYNLTHSKVVEADADSLCRALTGILRKILADLVFNTSPESHLAYCDEVPQSIARLRNIWIQSCDAIDDGHEVVKLSIGSPGLRMTESGVERIFSPFADSRESPNISLGLAAARKIIRDQAGKVSCDNSNGNGWAFHISLKVSPTTEQEAAEKRLIDLPNCSADFKVGGSHRGSSRSYEDGDAIEDRLFESLQCSNRQLRVLVVDDEVVYQTLVRGLIECSSKISEKVDFFTLSSVETATANALALRPDVILMDVDLGHPSLSGFDVTAILREQGFINKICIHSNRGAFEYQGDAINSGADLFLPKPVSRAQLMRLLLSVSLEDEPTPVTTAKVLHALAGDSPIKGSPSGGASPQAVEEGGCFESFSHKHLIVLDDSILILESWKCLKGIEQKRFLSPEVFYEAVVEDPEVLSRAFCIVTDYHFDEVDSDMNGIEFAKRLRGEGVDIPIFLASDGVFSADDILHFNGKVSKVPHDAWEEIVKKL